MKLSICMMIKNEEKNLDRCLSSLEPLMTKMESELIIVDTGSTDDSVKIAKKYTDKIYHHQWSDDFSSMRNITIDYAQGEWIFIVDADEEITDEEKLIDLLNSKTIDNVNTIHIWCKSYMKQNVEETAVVIITPRLFRRGTIRYEGAVHNQPHFSSPAGYLDIILNHYGYIIDDKELMEKKYKRTVGLLKKELEKDPNNIYYRYQIANSYRMYGDSEKALDEIKIAYNYIEKEGLNFREYKYVLYQRATVETACGHWEEVVDICKKGIEIINDYIDLYFLLAQALEKLNLDKESIYYFEKYLELLENFNNLNIRLDPSIQFYTLNLKEQVIYNLIVLYERIDNENKALEYITSLSDEKLILDVSVNLILLAIKSKKFQLIGDFYKKQICNKTEVTKELFCSKLEKILLNIDLEEQKKIYEIFWEYNGSYGDLNKLRIMYCKNSDDVKSELIRFNVKYNIGIMSDYYGDVIYYMLKFGLEIDGVFSKHSEINISKKLKYCSDKFNDFVEILEKRYNLNLEDNMNFSIIRTNKIIGRVILLLDPNNKNYKHIFDNYINYGILYMKLIYTQTVLDYEMILDLKDSEEIFLLYMNKAVEKRKINHDEYLRYLRKALKNYPEMKRGIELLLDEYKSEQVYNNEEFINYSTTVKKNIKNFIELNVLNEAELLINEYEKILPNDTEIVLLKSQLAVKRLKQVKNEESDNYSM